MRRTSVPLQHRSPKPPPSLQPKPPTPSLGDSATCMLLGAHRRQLSGRGDGGQSIPCDRDQHVQHERGTTTQHNTHCAHRGPQRVDHLNAGPISASAHYICMEGWWEEGACMHEAARPLIAIRGGSSTRQTLKPSHLMHAYVQDVGFLNLRTGRGSLSGCP